MFILIEGPDGVGKTTLAKNLCERYNYGYMHFGVPDSHPIDYWMREGLARAGHDQVIDRLHLSEEAYGPVYRNGSQLTDHQFWLLEGWLWARNTMVVICSTTWENMKANHAKVKGEYHDDKQKQIVSAFQKLLVKTSLPMCVYDYTKHNGHLPPVRSVGQMGTSSMTYDLHDLLNRRDFSVNFEDHGIGTVRPRVWLVGDQPNPNMRPPVTPLFQPAFQTSSGEYLRKTVNCYSFWSETHLSNARDVTGKAHELQDKWYFLGNPKVVALGNNAADSLAKAGVPCRKVPHPQWWRRFRHNDVQEYTDAIRNAASW